MREIENRYKKRKCLQQGDAATVKWLHLYSLFKLVGLIATLSSTPRAMPRIKF